MRLSPYFLALYLFSHYHPKHTPAVHQKSSTNSDPIFVFGTTILIKDDLYVEGYGYKILFKVTDTKLKRSALEAPVNYQIIHLIFEYTCCICCLK